MDTGPVSINVLLHRNDFTLNLPTRFFHLDSTSHPFVCTRAGGKCHSRGVTENPGICVGLAILNGGTSESL